MADSPLPQADSLPKLRRLLERTMTSGNLAAAGESLGLAPRHVGYYAAAAEALELARRRGRSMDLSPLGRRLLTTEADTPDETRVWRTAIEKSRVVRRVAPSLLDVEPTKDELTARIARNGKLSQTTAPRRAETLLRWRHYVIGAETQPFLPRRVTETPGVRYKGRAMLRSLSIQSFKAFGEAEASSQSRDGVTIDLAPLTVLAGPNGAGKTTILQALEILGALVRGTIKEMLDAHDWDYGDLPHLLSAKQTMTLRVEVEIGESVMEWTLMLGTRKHPGIEAERVRARGRDNAMWRTLLDRKGRHVTFMRETTGESISLGSMTLPQSWLATRDANAREDCESVPGLLRLKAWAENIRAFWSLTPSTLRSPSRGLTTHVGVHGGDLASFLFQLKKRDPKRFATFVQRVAKYYPRLVDIEPKSAGYGWKYLAVTERWNGEKATFNAKQVSDGLLRLMAVASIPDWGTPPSVVLLDEIENGLHPRLIGGLAALLEEVSKSTQVITTTHSPITLNYVPAEGTRLVTRGKRGTVAVTPLMKTKNYERLREHFEPGELWYNVGEDRLIKQGR